MKVNGIEIKETKFAYDGCHKIYVLENREQEKESLKIGYEVLPINQLENVYNKSCSLRFISYWNLDRNDYRIVGQFEEIIFN